MHASQIHEFFALYAIFEEGAQDHHRGISLLLAALTLAPRRGRALADAGMVQRTRTAAAALGRRKPWHSATSGQLDLVVAAQLVRRGVDAEAFYDELLRVRGLFRAGGVRRDEPRETIATLLLADVVGGAAGRDEVARLRAIYAALKRHHWFLTGADDLPACALLVAEAGAAEAIADGVEALYQGLGRAGLGPGDLTQRVALTLYLGPRDGACERVAALRSALVDAGETIWQPMYPALGLLASPGVDAKAVVAEALELRERVVDETGVAGSEALNFAAACLYLRRARDDPRALRVFDLEALLQAYSHGIAQSGV